MDVLHASVKLITDRLTNEELAALNNLAHARWDVRPHEIAPKVASLLNDDGRVYDQMIEYIGAEVNLRIGPLLPPPKPEEIAAVREAMANYRPDLADLHPAYKMPLPRTSCLGHPPIEKLSTIPFKRGLPPLLKGEIDIKKFFQALDNEE